MADNVIIQKSFEEISERFKRAKPGTAKARVLRPLLKLYLYYLRGQKKREQKKAEKEEAKARSGYSFEK